MCNYLGKAYSPRNQKTILYYYNYQVGNYIYFIQGSKI
jgi:hypothetical protein